MEDRNDVFAEIKRLCAQYDKDGDKLIRQINIGRMIMAMPEYKISLQWVMDFFRSARRN